MMDKFTIEPFIENFLHLIDYKITTSDKFLWKCFGNNSWSYTRNTKYGHVDCVFDTDTQSVYQVTIESFVTRDIFVWTDPEYVDDFWDEVSNRNLTEEYSNNFETGSFNDIMEKSENILNNRTYTSDVVVNIQCTEEGKEKIEKLAFEAGQTVDEYMANVFIEKINDEKTKNCKAATP